MDLNDLADALGLDRKVLQAYLDGTTIPPMTKSDLDGLHRLDRLLHDVTETRTAGIHVDYIDAAIFTDADLAAIQVTPSHPAIRLVFHANDETTAYTTSVVLAEMGRSALDLARLEGAESGAVARVVLTRCQFGAVL